MAGFKRNKKRVAIGCTMYVLSIHTPNVRSWACPCGPPDAVTLSSGPAVGIGPGSAPDTGIASGCCTMYVR